MELFVTLFNGFQSLSNATKNSISDNDVSSRSVSVIVYTQPLKSALDKNCHRDLCEKSSWDLQSKSLKNTLKDSFWLLLPTYFTSTLFFSIAWLEKPFSKNSHHLETGQLICIWIERFLYVKTSACINAYYIIRKEEQNPSEFHQRLYCSNRSTNSQHC